MFQATAKAKDFIAEIHRAKVYDQVRNDHRFGAKQATDHDLRVIYQTVKQYDAYDRPVYPVLAMPSSETGENLCRLKLARVEYSRHGVEYSRHGVKYDELVLTDLGIKVRDFLYLKLIGTASDPNHPTSRSKPVTPSTALVTMEEGPSSLQLAIKGIRTRWTRRPRFDRFTIRSWCYRWRLWILETQPEIPLIDWSTIPVNGWTEEDAQDQREAWHRSGLLAFWLCPDGIEAGIAAHDKLEATCEAHGIISGPQKEKVISDITGVTPQKPKLKAPVATSTTTGTTYQVFTFNTNPHKNDKYFEKLHQETYQTKKLAEKAMEAALLTRYPADDNRTAPTPCGHTKGVVWSKSRLEYVQCRQCGASWIPASNNILKIASDEPDSYRAGNFAMTKSTKI